MDHQAECGPIRSKRLNPSRIACMRAFRCGPCDHKRQETAALFSFCGHCERSATRDASPDPRLKADCMLYAYRHISSRRVWQDSPQELSSKSRERRSKPHLSHLSWYQIGDSTPSDTATGCSSKQSSTGWPSAFHLRTSPPQQQTPLRTGIRTHGQHPGTTSTSHSESSAASPHSD